MDNREFVTYAKRYAVDGAVDQTLQDLNIPRQVPEIDASDKYGISAWLQQQALAKRPQIEWFAHLNQEHQKLLRDICHECAENVMFHFLSLIDGIGGSFEGVFEIVAVNEEERTTLNPQNTDMLHSLFSEICEEDRRNSALET